MRTIIDLREEQIQALAERCERDGLSRSEAIRRAVDLYLCETKGDDLEAAFGAWRDKRIDGVDFQRKLRAEWDR